MSTSEDIRIASNAYEVAIDEMEKAQQAVNTAQQALTGAQSVSVAANKKAEDAKAALKALIDSSGN